MSIRVRGHQSNALTIPQRADDLNLGRKLPRRKPRLGPLRQALYNTIPELLPPVQIRRASMRVDEFVRPRRECHRPRHRLAVQGRVQEDNVGQERGYYRHLVRG